VTDTCFLRNTDTNAVITGGTQGLGLEVAKRLAREGAANIAICGRNRERGEAAASQVRELGSNCIFIHADVADADDCRGLMQQAIAAFGTVNALVNSAASTNRGTLLETSLDLWDEHFNTNVRGPFLTMQALVEHLLEKRKPGSIVNVLSINVHCGQPFLPVYSASKGALATLTKNVANAYRFDRIRCNGIQTGWMDTPGETVVQKKFHGAGDDWLAEAERRQPMGQLVKPDQLASLIAYMLSPESGIMTGSLVDYDQNVIGAMA
jgi:NAD(P)-dependent dehydrogenase (short-subunit alcohol dehydrogenase family)